ncbi:MAG: hypothetical protein CMJ81_02095 [Planctomycetaceae bacterium]|nr:hypothetical protein [Planctomycetaceae bacterium]MBP61187.1 hypothetical protein [Planctomycetaceae bacterium]
MSWFQRVFSQFCDSSLPEIANEIADRQKKSVWELVHQRVRLMPPAEARGYVHARVSGMVHAEVDRAYYHRDRLKLSLRERLVRIVQAKLVDQVLVELRERQYEKLAVGKAA